MVAGYFTHQKKEEKELYEEAAKPASQVTIKIAPKPSVPAPEIAGMSDSVKAENVRNLIRQANDKLEAGEMSEVRVLTAKINTVYRAISASSEKEKLYEEFMKLYDDIKKKL